MTMKHPTPTTLRRAGILAAGLAGLLDVLGAAATPKASLAPRELRYLELGVEQIKRMEAKRGGLGPEFQQNLAAGALASAALASEGKADAAKRREDAARW